VVAGTVVTVVHVDPEFADRCTVNPVTTGDTSLLDQPTVMPVRPLQVAVTSPGAASVRAPAAPGAVPVVDHAADAIDGARAVVTTATNAAVTTDQRARGFIASPVRCGFAAPLRATASR
jgi:hypothetical protein